MTISGPMTHSDTRLPLRRLPRYAVTLVRRMIRLPLAGLEETGTRRVSYEVLRFTPRKEDYPLPSRAGALLTRFTALRTEPVERAVAFALDFGPLQLCARHGLPAGGGPDHPVAERGARTLELKPADSCGPALDPLDPEIHFEPVMQWRAWAIRLAGARRLGESLRAGERWRAVDVADAFHGLPLGQWLGEALSAKLPPRAARFHFAGWLTYLLDLAGVRPGVRATSTLELVEGLNPGCPLFSALILDLAAVTTGAVAVRECQAPGCTRQVVPRLGTERYCSRCRRNSRARWRLAKRTEREALRERGLSARGLPLT